MDFDGFDWDDGNWPKCGKHGVTKAEIEELFGREELIVLHDRAHSLDEEDRYLAVVLNVPGHAGLLVGFTFRELDGKTRIRPVTARYMHAREAAKFEHTEDE